MVRREGHLPFLLHFSKTCAATSDMVKIPRSVSFRIIPFALFLILINFCYFQHAVRAYMYTRWFTLIRSHQNACVFLSHLLNRTTTFNLQPIAKTAGLSSGCILRLTPWKYRLMCWVSISEKSPPTLTRLLFFPTTRRRPHMKGGCNQPSHLNLNATLAFSITV